MTVLVIGLGSMGRRRIRLLQKYDSRMKVIGVDKQEERCETVQSEYGIKTFTDFEEACIHEGKIDCAFISTSPLSHAALIHMCLKKDMHVFTELNLVDIMYDENMKLAEEKERVLFLSSTFLYRKEIIYMHEEVEKCKSKINYMYHAGQYLPDWHPWENYKNFFVGDKKTNGCREFMAIEFPWLTDVFGKVESLKIVGGNISSLEVDYPDNYIILLEHEGGSKGAIAIDIVSRKASRNLEVFGEDIYLTWNGTPDGLYRYDYEQKKDMQVKLYDSVDKRSDYSATIIEDAYYSEICNFFQTIRKEDKPKYSFAQDREILKLIDFVEADGGKL